MAPWIVLAGMALCWMGYLVAERVRLQRDRRRIPLRIAVSGTRGKTTVTRRLASVLAQDGRRVLAKTTGSEASYLLPDGTVQEIHRLGAPSIIEQKRLLRRGATSSVDAIVAEMMSLHPEYHQIEAREILRPHLVLVTNFRVDHMEAQGTTREEVASVLALDVPPGSTVMVPEEEMEDRFRDLVTEAGAELVVVPTGAARNSEVPWGDEISGAAVPSGAFRPNLDLVFAAARSLGVGEGAICRGLSLAQDDIGGLKVWRYQDPDSGAPWWLVNAFAANDPVSTMEILQRLTAARDFRSSECLGLLSLRADRGDRTLQWAHALQEGALDRFRMLFVSGLHARALKHRLRGHPNAGGVRVLRPGPPEEITRQLLKEGEGKGGLLFGFGNIAGLGRHLIRYWRKVGEIHGI